MTVQQDRHPDRAIEGCRRKAARAELYQRIREAHLKNPELTGEDLARRFNCAGTFCRQAMRGLTWRDIKKKASP